MIDMNLHATCVCMEGHGVLLLGPSGAGKSDLALRLVDHGALLVADDRVEVARNGDLLVASPPETLRGLLEVRGVGIAHVPYQPQAPLALAVQLVARAAVERLPEGAFWGCLGVQLSLLSLHAFDQSTPAKIRIALLRRE